jgi:hypothetical protein
MPSYHLTVKPVSRSAGRSATAAAAYRAGELVHDHTTGQAFDYRRKRGVEHREIVLPTEAAKQDIHWARDREALWNAAELAERRKDSRLAREYEVALPHELTKAQRLELTRAFAADIANRYGVAVDFAMHAPHRRGDQRNYHAHLLATTRVIEPTGFGRKADIELGDRDRWQQQGLGPAKEEIRAIRAHWAELTNEKFQELGLPFRVDHRTLEAQGIEREPTVHLGPAVSALERRGERSQVLERIAEQAKAHEQTRVLEHAQLERESRRIESAILDLSGDLRVALTERERQRGRAKVPAAGKSVNDLQREGRAQWLAMRETAKVAEQERSRALAPEVEPVLGRAIETPALVAWREAMAAKPIEHQAQVLEELERRLQRARSERLARVRERQLARFARREAKVRALRAREPEAPTGLLSGFRRRAYEESHHAWSTEWQREARLLEQSRALDRKLAIAADPMNLGRRARSLMLERDRGLVERVHEYQQRQREIERERSRTLERGRDRDFDLSR